MTETRATDRSPQQGQPASRGLIQFYSKLGGDVLESNQLGTTMAVHLNNLSIQTKSKQITNKQSALCSLKICV